MKSTKIKAIKKREITSIKESECEKKSMELER